MVAIEVEEKKKFDFKKFSIILGIVGVTFVIIMIGVIAILSFPTQDLQPQPLYNVTCTISTTEHDQRYVKISYKNGSQIPYRALGLSVHAPEDYPFIKDFTPPSSYKKLDDGFTDVYIYTNIDGSVVAKDIPPDYNTSIDFVNGKWRFYTSYGGSVVSTCWMEFTGSKTTVLKDPGAGIYQTIYYSLKDYETILIDGNIYREHIVIQKPLKLIGVNNAVIDSGNINSAITIMSSDVFVRGLQLLNSGNTGYFDGCVVVHDGFQNIMIAKNIMHHCKNGIFLHNNAYVKILNNTIYKNDINGILIDGDSKYNIIRFNNIYDNTNGIYTETGNYMTITENIISNNTNYGIFIRDYRSKSNICEYNYAYNNKIECSDIAVRP